MPVGLVKAADSKGIHEFSRRALPAADRNELEMLVAALVNAASRYERYAATRDEWRDYAGRKRRLERIGRAARALVDDLANLDSLSRDDLEIRLGSTRLSTLTESLVVLQPVVSAVVEHVQTSGRPHDLAEERWIVEVADIYETFFHRPAAVWGSGDDAAKRRSPFQELLTVSVPASLPRHGKLSLRQVDRVLKRRDERRSPGIVV